MLSQQSSKEICPKRFSSEPPEGLIYEKGRVYKLKRAIYGLKQSSQQWNKKLGSKLKAFRLKQRVDPCVYYNKYMTLILATYVDNILIFWVDVEVKDKLKKAFYTTFKMKDIRVTCSCVGLQISYESDTICLNQEEYTKQIVKKINLADCKKAGTPSNLNQKLSIPGSR